MIVLYLGREIPQGAAGLSSLDMTVVKLFSFPLQASMKNNLGFPTRSWTSHISVTRDSIFQVLAPSLSWRKLSAVPWLHNCTFKSNFSHGPILHLMTRSKKQEASAWSSGRVSWRFKLFIPWLVKSRWISTLNPGKYLQTWQIS